MTNSEIRDKLTGVVKRLKEIELSLRKCPLNERERKALDELNDCSDELSANIDLISGNLRAYIDWITLHK